MQTVTVYPGAISGHISAPPSKSVMQRVLAALLLRGGNLTIQNPGNSADDQVVMQVLKDAGFSFSTRDQGLFVQQSSRHPVTHANFGESGLAARLLIPILALQEHRIELDASPGLRARPMNFIDEILPKLGVRVSTTAGTLPANIQGPLQPADITVDASGGSQALSGLLMAYAGGKAKGRTIQVKGLVSKHYIDLTLQVMEAMGLPMPTQQGYTSFHFPEEQILKPAPDNYRIEGDWSGAAFMLVAGAIAGKITVTDLDAFSTQGDKGILQALMDAGAHLSIESAQITVATGGLNAFHFNATDTPDLFPPLAALACYANGTSVIGGVNRLQHKESNRASTISEELAKMGADISLQDDYMVIRGGTPLLAAKTSSHNDHRIAMMCAVAALGASGPVIIEGMEAISKSYPTFIKDLETLGARIETSE